MPSITSTPPPVAICQTTGLTTFTCGMPRSTSATFTETGAPLMPAKNDDPGGCTITSAPIPAVRFLLSFMIP